MFTINQIFTWYLNIVAGLQSCGMWFPKIYSSIWVLWNLLQTYHILVLKLWIADTFISCFFASYQLLGSKNTMENLWVHPFNEEKQTFINKFNGYCLQSIKSSHGISISVAGTDPPRFKIWNHALWDPYPNFPKKSHPCFFRTVIPQIFHASSNFTQIWKLLTKKNLKNVEMMNFSTISQI